MDRSSGTVTPNGVISSAWDGVLKRTQVDATKRGVGYIRVSTCRQEIGPEAQRAAIESFAAANGISVVGWYADAGGRKAKSGALPIAKRPALAAALQHLQTGDAARLLVDDRDRLSRDMANSFAINSLVAASGGRVLSVKGPNGDTDEDTIARLFQDLLAEVLRIKNRRRTLEAIRFKRERGESLGEPPFGFRRSPADNKTLVQAPHEQYALWCIASLRRRRLGYHRIELELARLGFSARTGQPICKRTIRTICQRLRIVADQRFGEPLPDEHRQLAQPPIWQMYRRALREGLRVHPSRSDIIRESRKHPEALAEILGAPEAP